MLAQMIGVYNHISEIILILIILQGVLFALFLFTQPKGKAISNQLLAWFTLTLSANFLFVLLKEVYQIKALFNPNPAISLSFAPLLFLYTQSMMYKNFQFKTGFLWHFLASFLVLGFIIINHPVNPSFIINSTPFIILQMIPYLLFSSKKLNHYQQIIQKKHSSIDKINLQWLKFTLNCFLALVLLALVNYLLTWFGWGVLNQYMALLIFLFVWLMVNAFVFKGLRQPQVFQGIEKSDVQIFQKPSTQSTDIKTHQDIQFLQKYMQQHQPYTEHTLSLNDLADQLKMPARYVSQLLNQHLGQNFFEFVNQYRIQKAQEMLTNPDQQIRINEVMYDVGFSSKSSFNTLFKRYTGQTPSQFRKRALNK